MRLHATIAALWFALCAALWVSTGVAHAAAGSYSIDTYTASGSASFAVTFPYIKQADVLVADNGTVKVLGLDYTFTATNTITFTTPPTSGHVIILQRETQLASPLVVYSAGALSSQALNLEVTQQLYLAQERADFDNGYVPPSVILPNVSTALAAAQGASTARTVAAHFLDNLSVLDEGADPSGTVDSTTAFAAAEALSNHVYIPCGIYLVNWTINVSDFTATGNGNCTELRPATPGTDVVTISGGNFGGLSSLNITNRSSGAGNGVTLNNGTGNIALDGLTVVGFVNGIYCAGTSMVPTSGNQVLNSYLLDNSNDGLKVTFCADMHIQGNQMGLNTNAGIEEVSSSASQTSDNFAWQNGNAIIGANDGQNWWSRNRITQSNTQGFICSNCFQSNVEDNQSYQNSEAATGTYEDFELVGASNVAFVGNNAFDWTGIAHTDYGLTIDSTSTLVNVTGNLFSFHTAASASISTAATGIIAKNNLPVTDASVNVGTNRPQIIVFANLTAAAPSPQVGDMLTVSDASACTVGTALAAGGGTAHSCLEAYNGANWFPVVTH